MLLLESMAARAAGTIMMVVSRMWMFRFLWTSEAQHLACSRFFSKIPSFLLTWILPTGSSRTRTGTWYNGGTCTFGLGGNFAWKCQPAAGRGEPLCLKIIPRLAGVDIVQSTRAPATRILVETITSLLSTNCRQPPAKVGCARSLRDAEQNSPR